MKIENEKPRRYYAKHMVQGVAGYKDFNLYASNEAILKMEKSFEGKPLLVDHQDVDHDNLKNQMDGVVVKSFYNKWDGWHWCEIVAITDQAVEAIENKSWKVSNCYSPSVMDTKGTYLNIAYDQVLESGEYDHLALVSNPRYEDSVVLTPSEFKAYNEAKEQQFISNSKAKKPKEKRMFEFFKKVKVENDINPEELIVKLENGEEISVADAIKKISNEVEFDILDRTVLVNDVEVMLVSELVSSYEELLANAKKNEDEEKEEKEENEDDEDDVENDEDDEEEEDKENEEDEVDLENSVFQNHLDLINSLDSDKTSVMTDIERVELGKERY